MPCSSAKFQDGGIIGEIPPLHQPKSNLRGDAYLLIARTIQGRFWSDGRQPLPYRITEELPVIQELRCVRVLDPIPTKPSCVVSFLDDSGLLTSARTDELSLSTCLAERPFVVRQQHPGHTRARAKKCARVARPLSRAATMIDVRGRQTFSSFVAARRTMSYSCRRASSGSIRDARLAGA